MNLTLGLLFLVLGLMVVAFVAARNRAVAAPLVIGYALRALFVVADELFLGLSRAGDGYSWHFTAMRWADQGLDEIVSHTRTGHELYRSLMAYLYYFVGESHVMIQMINALFGSLIIVVAWKAARALGAADHRARWCAWLVALFPSMILHSGLLLREVAVTYPLVVGVYHLATWHRGGGTRHAVLAVLGFGVSMAFHSGTFAVLLALTAWVGLGWFRALLTGQGRRFLLNSVALLLAGLVVLFASQTRWGMSKFAKLDTDDPTSLATTQRQSAKGRAGYLGDLQAETMTELVVQSPLRVSYFLFAPFPWMLSTFRDILGLADALLFAYLVFFVLRARKVLSANPTAMLVAAIFAAMAFTFALGVSNYGTAFRHRSKMLPVLVAVVACLPARRPRPVRGAVAPALGPPPPLVQHPG